MRTLQQKFAVLLGVFAVIVALSVGVALLFGNHLERELSVPLEENSIVLRDLARLKRATGELTKQLPGPARDVPGLRDDESLPERDPETLNEARRAFEADRASVASSRHNLLAHAFVEERVGASTLRNLDARVREASRLSDEWFETGDIRIGIEAGEAHYQIHELIEQIERKIIEDVTDYATDYNREVGRSFRVTMASGIAVAVLVGVLGVLLVKRWVITPVEELRVAADHLARGDFTHRLSPRTSDELGRLASEVNHMAGMIDQMQREAIERERLAAMGEMVRRLAHNIRNPLSGIRSIAELSKRRAQEDAALREDQQSIISTVDRFNSWLTELLDATSPLTIQFSTCDVRPWLKDTVASQRPIATMKSIDVVVEDDRAPEKAVFDPRHLEHAVVGILTNALQASPNNSTVTVRAHENGGDRWTIEIEDEGPGIPVENREKIFRPYFTTKSDGNGIGLAVTNHVVTQHNGTIRIESPEKGGTRFVIDLPTGHDSLNAG